MTKQNEMFLQLFNSKVANNRKIENAIYSIEKRRNKDDGYKYNNLIVQYNEKNNSIIF